LLMDAPYSYMFRRLLLRLTEVNAPITGNSECNRFCHLLANAVAQNPR